MHRHGVSARTPQCPVPMLEMRQRRFCSGRARKNSAVDRFGFRAALGFSGIYERSLAAWAGFAGDPQGYRAFAEAERTLPLIVRQASALEE
jgi:hypothetical protein